ncbi:hypothetical protein [Prosthecobacter sp.]|uniref:hypothetical protein n=1 Tax=Prosthecobacter sp. TaxID=1965333 RepID=UPI003782FDED
MHAAALLFLSLCTLALAHSDAGPPIIVDDASPAIFPKSWLTPAINATAVPLEASQQQPCISITRKALAKYPPAVLRASLKGVYLLGRLGYSGVSAGGTNSKDAVYLVKNERISTTRLENNFHAEFSSILLRNFPRHLDSAPWQQLNPPGFAYRHSGVQAIKNKQASLTLTDTLHEEGFLNEYGKASIEEDFNSYAARLFMGDAALWRAIDKYPKVQAKAALAIAFYQKLDPFFTREWFLSLRQPASEN